MSTSPIVLELGTLVNFGPIAEGFSSITEIARTSTNTMAAGFTELAAATSTADDQMIGSMAALGTAVQALTASSAAMPARVVPAVAESAGAFTILEERMVEAAATAKISAAGIGSAFGGLGALLGGGLVVGMIGHLLDETNKEVIALGNLADKSGISISALAGLQLITRELGVDFGTVEQGLVRLDRAQALAVEGGKAQTAAFERIGISIQELRSLTPEELLNRVSEGIHNSGSSADSAASAFALLGRGGSALIPIFKQYGDTLDDVITKTGAESGVTDQARQEALKWQKTTADLGDELRELGISVIPLITNSFINFGAFIKDVALEGVVGFQNLETFVVGTAKAVADAAKLNFDQAAKDMDDATKEVALRNEITADQVAGIWENAAARIKGVDITPTSKERDVPTEGKDHTAKRGEQAAAYKDLLESELSALSAETAGQKVLYEQQEITGQEWIASVERNTEAALQAENNYFARLKALYADDPVKLAAINSEQAKTGYSTLAREENELAASTKKLSDETREYVAQSQKAETKEQETDIKSLTKVILERAAAVEKLIASEKTLDTAQGGESGSAQVEKVKEEAAQNLITKHQEAEQILAIYEQEKKAAIDAIQAQIDAGQQVVTAAKLNMTQMAALHGPGSEQDIEAQAAYARDLAAFNNLLTQKLNAEKKYDREISSAQDQADAEYTSRTKQVTDTITSDFAKAFDTIIFHSGSLRQAMTKLWESIAESAITGLAKVAAAELTGLLLHTASSEQQRITDAKTAASGAYASVSSIPIVGPFLAPEAAAGAFAAVLAFEKGGIVPEDMMGQLHGGEMVLPKELSIGVQNMVTQGAQGPAGQDGAIAGTQIGALNFHYHAGSGGGGSDITKDGEEMFKFMKGKLRRMGVKV